MDQTLERKDYREISRMIGYPGDIKNIPETEMREIVQLGCLQRIADALERIEISMKPKVVAQEAQPLSSEPGPIRSS